MTKIFNRNLRRPATRSFFGCCTNSETDPLIDPIIRAEARETVERLLQTSNLNSTSRVTILNENLQLCEDSIEVAANQTIHPQPTLEPHPTPTSSSVSSAGAAAKAAKELKAAKTAFKTAAKTAKRKVKQKVGAAAEQISSRYRNPFHPLQENN